MARRGAGKTSSLVLLLAGAAMVALAGGEVPPASVQLALPEVVHHPGMDGIGWQTDLQLLSPGDAPSEVWIGQSGDLSDQQQWRHLRLSPGSQLTIAGVRESTAWTKGDDAAGGRALMIAADSPVVALGRTYVSDRQGTFGQLVPAVNIGRAVAGSDQFVLPHLTHDAVFHTDIGLAEVAGERTEVEVELYDASGLLLGIRYHTLEPYGWLQDNSVFANVSSNGIYDGYAVVSSPALNARYLAYASVKDNASNDADLIVAARATAEPRVVLAAVHASGEEGTRWRTDLEVVSPRGRPAVYRIDMLNGDESASTTFSLGPGEARRHRDVLHEVFDLSGVVPLRIVPLAGELVATTRISTPAPSGSFGQIMPAVPEARAATSEQSIWLPGMAQTERFRTNLGLVNLAPFPVTFQVALYRDDGTLLATETERVTGSSLTQLNRVLATGDEPVASGYAVLTCTTPGARYLAYAAVIDQGTGDPLFVPPQVLPSRAE